MPSYHCLPSLGTTVLQPESSLLVCKGVWNNEAEMRTAREWGGSSGGPAPGSPKILLCSEAAQTLHLNDHPLKYNLGVKC